MVWSQYSILNIVIHGAQTPKYKNCLCCSSARILSWSHTFPRKQEFVSLWHHLDYTGKRWIVWKSVSFGSFSAPNLCFIQSFQTFPVKHSSAFSFHDNLPFIHQPASNNFLLSPKKSLKSNFIRIPGLMCCFGAESKNIH